MASSYSDRKSWFIARCHFDRMIDAIAEEEGWLSA